MEWDRTDDLQPRPLRNFLNLTALQIPLKLNHPVIQGFFLSLLVFTFYYHFEFQTPYLPEPDGAFHIKFSYLMRSQGLMRDFDWAQMGLWKDHFSDKEFLYHVFLIPFTFFPDLATGMKVSGVFLATLSILSFFCVLKLNGIRGAFAWALILLLCNFSFLLRNLMPRPHVLSLSILIWIFHFMLNKDYRKMFLLNLIYPWTYSGFILPPLFAMAFAVHEMVSGQKMDRKILYCIFGSTFLGVLVHPYFPHNLKTIYLTNFYILKMVLQSQVNLNFGVELLPDQTRNWVQTNLSFLALYLLTFYLLLTRPARPDQKTIKLFIVSCCLVLLGMIYGRFFEYAVPLAFMYAAFFLSPYLEKVNLRDFFTSRLIPTNVVLAQFLFIMFILGYFNFKAAKNNFIYSPSHYQDGAKYLKKYIPKGKTLYTCGWDYPSELFFFDHDHKYLVFLDPTFMYAWNPKTWETWNNLSLGLGGDATGQVIRETFGAEYGICPKYFFQLYRLVKKGKGLKLLYEDVNVYIFKTT